MMYKHHPYNNIVERKLEQLPATDTDALWSNMEGMLDKHLPQKKRRRGVFGWLFTHKAWMLAGFSALSLAGFSLVYLSGKDSRTAAYTSVTEPAKQATTATVPTQPAIAATQSTSNGPSVDAPATEATALTITTENTTDNTIALTAAPTATAAATQKEEPTNSAASTAKLSNRVSGNRSSAGIRTGMPVSTPVNASSASVKEITPADYTKELIQPQNNNTITHWASTTEAVVANKPTSPAVNPTTVVVNTTTLEHLAQQIATASAAAAKKLGKLEEEKGPYAGVVAGLDMSSVGMKSMKAGNNTGILIGYAFNNKWSVESGLQWNKKRLYAEGENYKPDNLDTQPGLVILDVTNSNQIYELPINVKYNILPGRHKLFVTAGMSSYFMKREAYSVSATFNGLPVNEYREYTNASKHWLSVANLSLGYSHKLGRIGSIRLEPYLRLPLREMGVGNMKVMSTGLNVGFTKTLKR